MKKLIDLGFKKVGNWYVKNGVFQYKLNASYKDTDILYSFVIDNSIMYIGKSTKTISQRLNGYRKPNVSQKTNFRVNKLIIEEIKKGKIVEIYLFVDNSNLNFQGHKINLSAGLEDNLIAKYQPKWNTLGKSRKDISKNRIQKNYMEKKFNEEIIVTIGEAYYNQGFFNIQSKYSELFSKNHLEPIKIQIEENKDDIITGKIYRTKTSNQTRINAGTEYKKWVQENFQMGDIFKVEVIEKGFIKLKK